MIGLVNAAAYAMMIYFTTKIFKTLKDSQKNLSPKVIQIQKQINYLLIAQVTNFFFI